MERALLGNIQVACSFPSCVNMFAGSGRGFVFDSTLGFPGEGPPKPAVSDVGNADAVRVRMPGPIFILFQAVRVDILRELYNRKLAGETVYTVSLAKKLKLPVSKLVECLTAMKLNDWLRGKGTWQSLEIQNHETLRTLLVDHGVDVASLDPMQALLNGEYHMIKWFRSCMVCDDGRVRFDIQWKGKPPPSSVCCHDLNASARIEVTAIWLVFIFICMCIG